MAFELVTKHPIKPIEVEAPAEAKKRKAKPKAEKPPRPPGLGPFGMVKQAKVQRIIRDEREALYWLSQEPGWIALDLETSGLSPWKDLMLVMGLYGPHTETAAVLHVQGVVSDDLKAFIGSEGRKFVTQNGAAFDIPYCHNAGIDWERATWYDTLIGEQVVTGTDRKNIRKDLQSIVKRRLGVDISKDVDHRDWLRPELSDDQVRYVAEDISFLPAIMEAQWAKADEVDARWGKNKFYGTGVRDALAFEMELMPAVIRMEVNGLPVDVPKLLAYEALQISRQLEAGTWLDAEFGPGVNWGSWQQILKQFDRLYGATLPSTQEDDLIDARDLSSGSRLSEALDQLLTYKHALKRGGMYGQTFLDKYVTDGWLHGAFRQMGTDTGRFSGANPNMQQLPGDARGWIGGHPDYMIIAPDYSQIEVRIMANEAEDMALIETFKGRDVHTMIAASVFGIPDSEVTKEQRKLSKAMSFTLLFGGGAARLSHYAKTLGADLPLAMAQPLVYQFFDRFANLKRMRSRAYSIAASGAPFTLNLPTGLRRVLTPGIDLTATRILNTIGQGTAAAGMKMGLLEAHKAGLTKYLGATVHDELVAAVPNALAVEYGQALGECMVVGMSKVCENVPVAVEVKAGRTWS
jgi:DNA polymerase I-like protein with 3'-5' exonuclease and polymerase domains